MKITIEKKWFIAVFVVIAFGLTLNSMFYIDYVFSNTHYCYGFPLIIRCEIYSGQCDMGKLCGDFLRNEFYWWNFIFSVVLYMIPSALLFIIWNFIRKLSSVIGS
jgi:hypothetical protein